MNPEFITGFTESNISQTCHNVEKAIQNFDSAKEYLSSVAQTYAETTNGRAGLRRMLRVAEFVTGPGEQASDADIHAFFYGELAATDLVTQLTAKPDTVGDFAHSYLEERLRSLREEAPYDESTHERNARQQFAAQCIRDGLSSDDPNVPDVCETYIHAISNQLGPTIEDAPLAVMGFRLVMQEFFRPHSYDTTEDVMLEVGDMLADSEIYVEHLMETIQSPKPHEFYKDAPTIEETEATLALDMSDAIETESLVAIRKTILRHFEKHTATFSKMDPNDPEANLAQYRLWEQAIKQEGLLTEDDLLLIDGDFFALFSNGDVQTTSLFNEDSSIRGTFAGIHIAQVPTAKELQRALEQPASHDRVTKRTVPSPVLRISNPTLIDYREEGTQRVIYADELTVDIPLIYETTDIDRVLPTHFN